MKKCPRCGSVLRDEVKFCPECGYNFFGKGKRRFWKEQKFENCEYKTVANWLRQVSGRYEILSIRAGIRYADESVLLIFNIRQFYFTYCTIRYYDDEAARGHYYYIGCSDHYDRFFTSGRTLVDRDLAEFSRNSRRNILHLRRESFVAGGSKIYGGVDIIEA